MDLKKEVPESKIGYIENLANQSTDLTEHESADDLELRLQPNPARDMLRIGEQDGAIKIYDLLGRLQLECPANAAATGIVDISTLQAGMHLICDASKCKLLSVIR